MVRNKVLDYYFQKILPKYIEKYQKRENFKKSALFL
jgi:hypothetical protein